MKKRLPVRSGRFTGTVASCCSSDVTLMVVSAVGRMEVQCAVTSSDIQSEDDQGGEMECDEDPQNWQSLVSHDILASLSPQEIKRQEVINGNDHNAS